jgi:hypothetical protein
MRLRARRKATILDAMILVAAVAGGLALSRQMFQVYAIEGNWFGRVAEGLVRVSAVLPFLMTLTPAVLLMRLRRPRPRWQRMFRQPGVAACAAAMGPVTLAWARIAYLDWHPPGPALAFAFDWAWGPGTVVWHCGIDAGLWVLAAWLALSLSGRRRTERGGIDRLGRVVGAGWLLVLAVRILGTS